MPSINDLEAPEQMSLTERPKWVNPIPLWEYIPVDDTVAPHSYTTNNIQTLMPQLNNREHWVKASQKPKWWMNREPFVKKTNAGIHLVYEPKTDRTYLAKQFIYTKEKEELLKKMGNNPEEIIQREAMLMDRLSRLTMHVPRVYDLIWDGEKKWIIMEYIKGKNLKELIKLGEVTPEVIKEIFDNVCQTLIIARQNGILYRDLKPDNIVVPEDKTRGPVLIDFGFANKVIRTRLPVILGSSGYIAPEIRDTRDINEKTEIYALGAIVRNIVNYSDKSKLPIELTTKLYEIAIKAQSEEYEERHDSFEAFLEDIHQALLYKA